MKKYEVSDMPTGQLCRFVRIRKEGKDVIIVGVPRVDFHRDLVAKSLDIDRKITEIEARNLMKQIPIFRDMGTIEKNTIYTLVGGISEQLGFPTEADLPKIREATMVVLRSQNPDINFEEQPVY